MDNECGEQVLDARGSMSSSFDAAQPILQLETVRTARALLSEYNIASSCQLHCLQ